MDKMSKRTEIDVFVIDFMLSELNSRQFLSNHLAQFKKDKSLIIERLTVLKDYFDNDYHYKELESFHEIVVNSIHIQINEFIIDKLSISEQLLYREELKIDAIQKRENELKALINKILPSYLKLYLNGRVKFENKSTGLMLEKISNKNFITKIRKPLIENHFISNIDEEKLIKYFNEEIPSLKKIKWLGRSYLLSYFIRELIKNKIIDEENDFWTATVNVFEKENGEPFKRQTIMTDSSNLPKNENGKSYKKLKILKEILENALKEDLKK